MTSEGKNDDEGDQEIDDTLQALFVRIWSSRKLLLIIIISKSIVGEETHSWDVNFGYLFRPVTGIPPNGHFCPNEIRTKESTKKEFPSRYLKGFVIKELK